jgi:hypothetical protein
MTLCSSCLLHLRMLEELEEEEVEVAMVEEEVEVEL